MSIYSNSTLMIYLQFEKISQSIFCPCMWCHQNFTNHINGEAEKSRALTPLTKQVMELTITQFRGSQASDQDGTSRCYMHLSGESLFCKGKANGWVFGGTQLLDLCAFKRLCYFTALWSKLISASYVNENWYSSLCSYSFLIPIIDWNF